MADPVQLPIDTPKGANTCNNSCAGGDAHNNSEGGNAHNNGAGGGDGGANGGGPPLPPPQDPADSLSEAHFKSIAEHVACFLAALHSSWSLLSSGKCKHLVQDYLKIASSTPLPL